MRLINTTTMKLEQFMGVQDVPSYTILSHTWGEGEVTLPDFSNLEVANLEKGFAKIEHTCRQARLNGIGYAWVDTCCIDKTSSAELTEAINSMFHLYASSAVCYAYLSDLDPEGVVDAENPTSQFAQSRWFRRGWTLQELIAPKTVEFYDRDWKFRGTKADLSRAISAVTGIDGDVLRDSSALFQIPVARRMSWAAGRQTSRLEDNAYSLLGIFDVNMPMLYGEGEKAFIRLQEEIAKETNDLTLFAWQAVKTNEEDGASQKYRGILAKSPTEFANFGDVVPRSDHKFNEEFVMTNKGLRINAELAKGSGGDYILSLNCSKRGQPEQDIGIYLKHHGASVYARDKPQEIAVASEWKAVSHRKNIYITKNINRAISASVDRVRHNAIRCRHGFDNGSISVARPESLWDAQNKLYLTVGLSSFAGILYFKPDSYETLFIIACAMSDSVAPWAMFLDGSDMKQISPALANPDRIFQLPKSIMMSQKIFFDKEYQPTRFCISMSFEEGVGDCEPMFCIDIQVDADQQSLPSFQENAEEGMKKKRAERQSQANLLSTRLKMIREGSQG